MILVAAALACCALGPAIEPRYRDVEPDLGDPYHGKGSRGRGRARYANTPNPNGRWNKRHLIKGARP